MKKILIILGMMIATTIFVYLFIGSEKELFVTNSKEEPVSINVAADVEAKDITDEEIKTLMDTFMDTLVQEVDNSYKVIHYTTLEELYEAFDPIATREVVEPYIEFFFTEEADGLYILPTETPPWFLRENPYDKEQITDNKVKVTQQNLTDLYGHYTIEIEFTYNTNWKITKITHLE